MPAYALAGKPLIYFGGFKAHIGLYATPAGHSAFAAELARYKHAKGSVQFPLAEPVPYDLIARMVAVRVQQVQATATAPRPPKKQPKPTTPRPSNPMPDHVRQALDEAGLSDAYQARPPYQRNDYLGWISKAVRDETKQKRLDQMLAEHRQGDVYMKMAWQPSGAP
jgi:hypothetical protein